MSHGSQIKDGFVPTDHPDQDRREALVDLLKEVNDVLADMEERGDSLAQMEPLSAAYAEVRSAFGFDLDEIDLPPIHGGYNGQRAAQPKWLLPSPTPQGNGSRG